MLGDVAVVVVLVGSGVVVFEAVGVVLRPVVVVVFAVVVFVAVVFVVVVFRGCGFRARGNPARICTGGGGGGRRLPVSRWQAGGARRRCWGRGWRRGSGRGLGMSSGATCRRGRRSGCGRHDMTWRTRYR